MAAKPNDIPALPKCKCKSDIPAHVTLCIVCGANVGYPNVRYAERPEEKAALERRLTEARISAVAKGSSERLAAFGQAVSASKAVICKPLGDLDSMVKGDGQLMQAYHPAVRAQLRMPQNNEFDAVREANDARINPHYYQKLHFGALSLDGRGVPHYGDFAITMRDAMTASRATVFEENPLKFNEAHPLGRNKPVPYGFRAVWSDRQKLAMAKLHAKIQPVTKDEEFPDILMEKTEAPDGYTDFVEVHIYGELHPKAFEHICAVVPTDELDNLLWERVKARLGHFEITYEEEPS